MQDVYSVLFRGVSLMIVLVFSLVADLSSKVRQKAPQGCRRVISMHLDEVKNVDAQKIIHCIKALPINRQKTVMLFASPQSLFDKIHWKLFVHGLIHKKMLCFMTVGEIQFFVHYYLSFRSQFSILSVNIFKQIKTDATPPRF